MSERSRIESPTEKPQTENLSKQSSIETRDSLLSDGCSADFVDAFFSQAELRKRVGRIKESFERNGEPFFSMSQAEIYCSLMEPGKEDVTPFFEAVSFEGKFPGWKNLVPYELAKKRLTGLVDHVEKLPAESLEKLAQAVMDIATKDTVIIPEIITKEWLTTVFAKTFSDKESVSRFIEHPTVREIYTTLYNDSDIRNLYNRINLEWKTLSPGVRIPTMRIEGIAQHPERKNNDGSPANSVLSFSIEGSHDHGPKNKTPQKRILKDIVIVTDTETRGGQSGVTFLLDKLSLLRKYSVQKVQFAANIEIGSYAWRFADLDVQAMAMANFDDKDWEAIGGKREWSSELESKAEKHLYTTLLLPVFKQNIDTLVSSLSDEWAKDHWREVNTWNAEWKELLLKAEAGDIVMEDLANFGTSGGTPFSFDALGHRLPPNTPSKYTGHLGKAAIMGIPWYAEVGTDRASLSRMIDKLYKGGGLTKWLIKASLLIR